MEDKQTKRGPGRPRTRDMESFWAKQREWTKSYYCRNRQKICIKQKIRYYRNKLRNADKADIARIEAKIATLQMELAELERGGHADEEEQESNADFSNIEIILHTKLIALKIVTI